MRKRVVDMAGTLGKTVKVELNGQKVAAKSFSEYVQLYTDSASKEGPDLPRFGIVFLSFCVSMKSSDKYYFRSSKFVFLSESTRR
jgi:hypothetical protein